MKKLILEQYPGADLSGPPERWLTGLVREPSGVISRPDVGGVILKGGELRKLLGLRSSCFPLSVAGDPCVVLHRNAGGPAMVSTARTRPANWALTICFVL